MKEEEKKKQRTTSWENNFMFSGSSSLLFNFLKFNFSENPSHMNVWFTWSCFCNPSFSLKSLVNSFSQKQKLKRKKHGTIPYHINTWS